MDIKKKEINSWYPATKVDLVVKNYLKLLQYIWKVKNAEDKWVPYILRPHQIHWHSTDIAILGSKAKHRLVLKSRNTSFTTSASISNLMAVPRYNSQIIPIIRLTKERAIDLISEIKELIKQMSPIRMPNGALYPFDPSKVDLDKTGSITFPNGTEFRAMPANAGSAEIIRGMRIIGSGGIIDEANFMYLFRNIYIALRDASRGANSDGVVEYQINIGTTRKGRMTNFNIWLEEILKIMPENFEIFNWQVLKYPKLNLDESLVDQKKKYPDMYCIVDWHNIEDLEKKRKENLASFREEYMTELVDSESQLYTQKIIDESIDEKLKNYDLPPKNIEKEELYYMGIDPAAVSDFFSISIFNQFGEQRFLNYERNISLDEKEKKCIKLIEDWKPIRVVIDGNGIGFQLSEKLKKTFGKIVDIIRGGANIKIKSKITGNIPIKEFLHTNMIKMMNYGQLKLLSDEMQIRHYMMWRNDFTADSDPQFGHGDIVISNGLALLPNKYKSININDNKVETTTQKQNIGEKEFKKNIINNIIEKSKKEIKKVNWG